uniref:Uncharacterized protein n=1 Tax=Anopheles merus TaxID=30066 RepID=A0A182VNG6_ANOME
MSMAGYSVQVGSDGHAGMGGQLHRQHHTGVRAHPQQPIVRNRERCDRQLEVGKNRPGKLPHVHVQKMLEAARMVQRDRARPMPHNPQAVDGAPEQHDRLPVGRSRGGRADRLHHQPSDAVEHVQPRTGRQIDERSMWNHRLDRATVQAKLLRCAQVPNAVRPDGEDQEPPGAGTEQQPARTVQQPVGRALDAQLAQPGAHQRQRGRVDEQLAARADPHRIGRHVAHRAGGHVLEAGDLRVRQREARPLVHRVRRAVVRVQRDAAAAISDPVSRSAAADPQDVLPGGPRAVQLVRVGGRVDTATVAGPERAHKEGSLERCLLREVCGAGPPGRGVDGMKCQPGQPYPVEPFLFPGGIARLQVVPFAGRSSHLHSRICVTVWKSRTYPKVSCEQTDPSVGRLSTCSSCSGIAHSKSPCAGSTPTNRSLSSTTSRHRLAVQELAPAPIASRHPLNQVGPFARHVQLLGKVDRPLDAPLQNRPVRVGRGRGLAQLAQFQHELGQPLHRRDEVIAEAEPLAQPAQPAGDKPGEEEVARHFVREASDRVRVAVGEGSIKGQQGRLANDCPHQPANRAIPLVPLVHASLQQRLQKLVQPADLPMGAEDGVRNVPIDDGIVHQQRVVQFLFVQRVQIVLLVRHKLAERPPALPIAGGLAVVRGSGRQLDALQGV